MEEVNYRSLQFRNIIQKFALYNLYRYINTSLYSPKVRVYSWWVLGISSFILILSSLIFLIISLVYSSSKSSSSSLYSSLLRRASSSRCSFCCMTILSLTTFSRTILFKMLPRSSFYIVTIYVLNWFKIICPSLKNIFESKWTMALIINIYSDVLYHSYCWR